MQKKWKLLLLLFTSLILVLSACNDEEEKSKEEKTENQEKKEEDKESDKTTVSMDEFAVAPTELNDNGLENLITYNTKNATRIPGKDPIETSIIVSQTIWPATHKENQPGTVILAPLGNWQYALAGTNLIHHPNNGPLLYINKDNIPSTVLNEIQRLNPLGNKNDTQVLVLGDVTDAVLTQLTDYNVEQITGKSPAEFALNIDKTYADVSDGYPQGVIIASAEEENKLYTIPAVNWIAHMPESILYVSGNELPQETIQALKQRKEKANIYLLGPEMVLSKVLEEQLSEYGKVKRIGAKEGDPVATSIEFAKFKDKDNKFGWGYTSSGKGIAFVSTEDPEAAIAAAPFSHLGKHAPLIWLDKGELQQETYDFLANIKPMFKDSPSEGPYNHAFIIGDTNAIPYLTQGIIDDKLEIVQETGEGHGGH